MESNPNSPDQSNLGNQIQEARQRAELFSKSLQEARQQENIALKILEEERARWTHSFQEKSVMIEQLERELNSTVDALHVERLSSSDYQSSHQPQHTHQHHQDQDQHYSHPYLHQTYSNPDSFSPRSTAVSQSQQAATMFEYSPLDIPKDTQRDTYKDVNKQSTDADVDYRGSVAPRQHSSHEQPQHYPYHLYSNNNNNNNNTLHNTTPTHINAPSTSSHLLPLPPPPPPPLTSNFSQFPPASSSSSFSASFTPPASVAATSTSTSISTSTSSLEREVISLRQALRASEEERERQREETERVVGRVKMEQQQRGLRIEGLQQEVRRSEEEVKRCEEDKRLLQVAVKDFDGKLHFRIAQVTFSLSLSHTLTHQSSVHLLVHSFNHWN